ncbi:hypothetical protein JCM30204_37670 [Dysgonomonas termitidis]
MLFIPFYKYINKATTKTHMDYSLQSFTENLLHMMRGAFMMMCIMMCMNLYPKRTKSSILNSLFWLFAIIPVPIALTFGFMIEELQENETFIVFKKLVDLCLVPLAGSFLLKIIRPSYMDTKKSFLLQAPTILFVIIFVITQHKIILILSFTYTTIIAAIIFFLIVFISDRYNRNLRNNLSNIDTNTIEWIRVVVYIYLQYGI